MKAPRPGKAWKESTSNLLCFFEQIPTDRSVVLVLGELPILDLLFPARTIPLVPFAAAQLCYRRVVVPGPPVGLALVLALLVDHHLRLLAEGGKAEREPRQNDS